jgi:hypothetical protein
MSELLKATADMMASKEAAVRLEGELFADKRNWQIRLRYAAEDRGPLWIAC